MQAYVHRGQPEILLIDTGMGAEEGILHFKLPRNRSFRGDAGKDTRGETELVEVCVTVAVDLRGHGAGDETAVERLGA